MVWIVYPEKRMVEVYQPDTDIDILFEGDVIQGGKMLPEFELKVADVLV